MAMEYYAGTDVSLKDSAVCIMDLDKAFGVYIS